MGRWRTTAWLVAAGATFAGGLILALALRPGGRAEELPGTVMQSGMAEIDGISIAVEKAVFSGAGTDVWIRITAVSPQTRAVGVAPSDADIGGSTGTSAVAGRDGRTVIRFPTASGLGESSTIPLTIRGVLLLGANDAPVRTPGSWRLELQLPVGKAAAAAAKLEGLQPGSVEVGGDRIVVEGFRTPSFTVVRYEVPPTIVANEPPSLKVGTATLQATRSQQVGNQREVWFESTPPGSSITVVFDRVLVSSAKAQDATLDLELTGVSGSGPGDGKSGLESKAMAWRKNDQTDVAVASIVVYRTQFDESVQVAVEGLWVPGLGGKPQVVADGNELFVSGVGNYPSTSDRGPRTIVEARLPAGTTPRSLVVRLLGAPATELPALEVTLKP